MLDFKYRKASYTSHVKAYHSVVSDILIGLALRDLPLFILLIFGFVNATITIHFCGVRMRRSIDNACRYQAAKPTLVYLLRPETASGMDHER